MRRKYKLTGCARFFIFLIIAVPVIYVSATLITGTSPWEELKLLIKGEEDRTELIEKEVSPDKTTTETEKDRNDQASEYVPATEESTKGEQKQLEDLLNRIEALENKIKELESQLNQ